jgi:Nitronate monooxygenase
LVDHADKRLSVSQATTILPKAGWTYADCTDAEGVERAPMTRPAAIDQEEELTMWPDRRLTDLLDIEHPIIQAPMAGPSTPELAAAVSNAGGLGSLAFAMLTAEQAASEMARLRALTNKGFNVNFFCHQSHS